MGGSNVALISHASALQRVNKIDPLNVQKLKEPYRTSRILQFRTVAYRSYSILVLIGTMTKSN